MSAISLRKMMIAAAAVGMFAAITIQSKDQDMGTGTNLTGVVSDAACGAKHSMSTMSAADCTRMCVKAGQGFALVVGDKVYSLREDSAELDKYAAQKITVKGKLKGNTVAVDSVGPAK